MKKQLIFGFTMALFTISLMLSGFVIAIGSDYPMDEEVVITGIVEQEGDAFILQANDGDKYKMTGQNLSNMIGKKVQATGELTKKNNENSLNVNEIIEAPDTPDLIVPLKDNIQ